MKAEKEIIQWIIYRSESAALLSPVRRRACINHVRSLFKVLERQACRVLGQHRCTQRHIPKGRADEDRLVADMIELARQFGRYGYRRIAALLREASWSVRSGCSDHLVVFCCKSSRSHEHPTCIL